MNPFAVIVPPENVDCATQNVVVGLARLTRTVGVSKTWAAAIGNPLASWTKPPRLDPGTVAEVVLMPAARTVGVTPAAGANVTAHETSQSPAGRFVMLVAFAAVELVSDVPAVEFD
ncbi:hypothetical protein BG61_16685 [Caballeronia glathei]|uniref:Uncharacterized protein n=1 Tax=Caballeronia glathei TaxID=60547 RepID=A0A069PME2_9BURK|nr:hypothetical protein BG61_16685 [Caballeronia glathei]